MWTLPLLQLTLLENHHVYRLSITKQLTKLYVKLVKSSKKMLSIRQMTPVTTSAVVSGYVTGMPIVGNPLLIDMNVAQPQTLIPVRYSDVAYGGKCRMKRRQGKLCATRKIVRRETKPFVERMHRQCRRLNLSDFKMLCFFTDECKPTYVLQSEVMSLDLLNV